MAETKRIENQRQLTAAIALALDEIGYHYRYIESIGNFLLQFKLKKSRMNEMQVLICVRDRFYLIYALAPVRAPRARMEAAAIYLAQCSYQLIYGGFALNPQNGEIHFKNSVPCYEFFPAVEQIEEMVNLPVILFDRYGDGLLDVLFAEKDPLEAYQQAEEA